MNLSKAATIAGKAAQKKKGNVKNKLMEGFKKMALKDYAVEIEPQFLPKNYAHAMQEIRVKEKDSAYGDYANATMTFNW